MGNAKQVTLALWFPRPCSFNTLRQRTFPAQTEAVGVVNVVRAAGRRRRRRRDPSTAADPAVLAVALGPVRFA